MKCFNTEIGCYHNQVIHFEGKGKCLMKGVIHFEGKGKCLMKGCNCQEFKNGLR